MRVLTKRKCEVNDKKKCLHRNCIFSFLVKIDKKEKKNREKRADKNSSVDHDLRSVLNTIIITDYNTFVFQF